MWLHVTFTGCSPGTGSYRPSFLPAASLKPLHKIQEGKFHYLMRSKRSKEGWQSVCVICPRQTSHRNQCSQAVPAIRCWHKRNYPDIILFRRFFQLSGRPEVNVMPGLWYRGFHFTKGERNRDSKTHLLSSLPPDPYLSLACENGQVLVLAVQGGPCGPRGPPRATNIPGKLKETMWILRARLDIESCIKRQSRTGNITTDLGDPSCHCACNQGWYENMKINNSFMLLFSGRRAFLFITLFIVGCHKYSRMIIAG